MADEHILLYAYLVDEVFDVFRCTLPDFSWTTTLLLTISCFNSYESPPPPPFRVASGASRESMFSGEAEDEPPFGLLGVGLTRLGLSPLECLNRAIKVALSSTCLVVHWLLGITSNF